MNSEKEIKGFRDRLAQLIGGSPPFAWATKIGLPSATFNRIWNEGQIPRADYLLTIKEATGCSIDWLLTGEGPMRLGGEGGQGEARPLTAEDPELMFLITSKLLRALAVQPHMPDAEKVLKLIRLIHDEVKKGEMKESEVDKNVERFLKIVA